MLVRAGSHANVSWLTAAAAAASSGDDIAYDDYGDHYDVDEDSDSDSDDETGSVHVQRSCIGVRKRCLVDDRCARQLASYRHYCRENKKQNDCVAVEWYARASLTSFYDTMQWRRQRRGRGELPPYGWTSKNYVICVCFHCHGTSSYHTTNTLQRATLIHRQYNRDWGTSYSRPPIYPYLTSPLL